MDSIPEKEVTRLGDNVLGFKLRTDGQEPVQNNWLWDLPEGEVFLCGPRDADNFMLSQFEVLHKVDFAVLLVSHVDTHAGPRFWVDSRLYSQKLRLHTSIGNTKEKEDG